MFGMLSGFDTLAPHAMGLQKYREVGILAQRGFVLSALAFVPACVPWLFASSLLQYIGQPEDAANLAASFLKYYILAVPAYLAYEVCRRFLIVQNTVNPFMAIGGATALVIHPVCLSILVPAIGFTGAPLAHVISAWLQLGICCLYMLWAAPHAEQSWPGWQCAEVCQPRAVYAYLALGLPGILSMTEWWFWEFLCFTAGEMGTQALAAHTVAYNLVPIMFMVPLGMSIGANVRVGTLLAAGFPGRARQVAVGTCGAYVVVGVVLCTIAYICGEQWAGLFTDDEGVLAQVRSIWPLVCFDVFIDSFFGVQSGVMRGIGMQLEASYGVIGCLWLVGLPAVRLVCFGWDKGLVGLWSTMPGLYGLLNIVLAWLWLRKDFGTMSEEIIAKAVSENTAGGPSALGGANVGMSSEGSAYCQVELTTTESDAGSDNTCNETIQVVDGVEMLESAEETRLVQSHDN